MRRGGSATNSLAEVGFEPTRPIGQGILSPQRLPFRHSAELVSTRKTDCNILYEKDFDLSSQKLPSLTYRSASRIVKCFDDCRQNSDIMAAMKNLLRELIRARPTPEQGELVAAKILTDYLAAQGIVSRIDSWDGNRANVITRIPSTARKTSLIFASHLDVVPEGEQPWRYPPFEAVETDGRIFGRGAADMKAGLVAAAVAVDDLQLEHTP